MKFAVATLAIAFALVAAAPAYAAEVSLSVEAKAGVRLGSATRMFGRVTNEGAPLPGRTVVLEVRRFPFKRAWRRTRITDVTDNEGRFSFSSQFDRNHRVRARVVGVPYSPEIVSPRRDAYVLPAFTLAFKQRGNRRLRLRQVYTVPRDVELSAPTRFYVGPCKLDAGECTARFAQFRAAAETRRVRPGRFVARATVRLPKSFRGRFQYVSCFRYSPGSGMGDPKQSCPRRLARVR
jgi:hypothetical protein